MTNNIIIIGGGASGLIAAYAAAKEIQILGLNNKVIILEKMPRVGRKIIITGKGRCNFSNIKPWQDFATHIRTKPNFIRPAFYNFNPENVINFLEQEGMATVVERGDRAYPASMRSMDVVDTFVKALNKLGVNIITNYEVTNITKTNEGFIINDKSTNSYTCSKLIICTGGLSYPGTGSTGDGYKFAKQFGHNITSLFPCLTAIVPKGYKNATPSHNRHIHRLTELTDIGKALCGVKLKNVGITLYANNNIIQNELGDIDFTDGGIEGPIGFAISRNCVKAIINGNKTKIIIDLKPYIDHKDLVIRLQGLCIEISKDKRSKNLNIKQTLKILLGKLIPWELVDGFIKLSPPIIEGKKEHERINLDKLCKCLKEWIFEIDGYVGYERCVITSGGVNCDEILPKTMESKLCPNLYIAGELLDVDCDTGGYNMQVAFSTGYLAGISAVKSL